MEKNTVLALLQLASESHNKVHSGLDNHANSTHFCDSCGAGSPCKDDDVTYGLAETGTVSKGIHEAITFIQGLEEISPSKDVIIESLTKSVVEWKANHKNEVERGRLLKSRADLPVERFAAYDSIGELRSTIKDLEESHSRKDELIAQLRAAVQDQEDLLAQKNQTISSLVTGVGVEPDVSYVAGKQWSYKVYDPDTGEWNLEHSNQFPNTENRNIREITSLHSGPYHSLTQLVRKM